MRFEWSHASRDRVVRPVTHTAHSTHTPAVWATKKNFFFCSFIRCSPQSLVNVLSFPISCRHRQISTADCSWHAADIVYNRLYMEWRMHALTRLNNIEDKSRILYVFIFIRQLRDARASHSNTIHVPKQSQKNISQPPHLFRLSRWLGWNWGNAGIVVVVVVVVSVAVLWLCMSRPTDWLTDWLMAYCTDWHNLRLWPLFYFFFFFHEHFTQFHRIHEKWLSSTTKQTNCRFYGILPIPATQI